MTATAQSGGPYLSSGNRRPKIPGVSNYTMGLFIALMTPNPGSVVASPTLIAVSGPMDPETNVRAFTGSPNNMEVLAMMPFIEGVG